MQTGGFGRPLYFPSIFPTPPALAFFAMDLLGAACGGFTVGVLFGIWLRGISSNPCTNTNGHIFSRWTTPHKMEYTFGGGELYVQQRQCEHCGLVEERRSDDDE